VAKVVEPRWAIDPSVLPSELASQGLQGGGDVAVLERRTPVVLEEVVAALASEEAVPLLGVALEGGGRRRMKRHEARLVELRAEHRQHASVEIDVRARKVQGFGDPEPCSR
jgi:hypothetical protein